MQNGLVSFLPPNILSYVKHLDYTDYFSVSAVAFEQISIIPFDALGRYMSKSVFFGLRSGMCTAVLLWCLGAEVAYAQIINESLSFDNFRHKVVLHKQGDYYKVEGRDLRVRLGPRLVVGVSPTLSKQALRVHRSIADVKKLFDGTLRSYFVVELLDERWLVEVMNKLQSMSAVELVQPDMLQLNQQSTPATARAEISDYNHYLSVIGIKELWASTLGEGVKLAIIDDGFNLKRRELKRVQSIFSYDINNRSLDVEPKFKEDSHGTKIAGVIFADHDMGIVSGLAPKAQLIALQHTSTWTSETLLSFQMAQLTEADIINCSWVSQWLVEPVANAVDELATYGRGGNGVAVVFSAGNEGRDIAPFSTEAAIDSAIVVGAHDLQFQKLSTSNFGPSVDVMSFGGRVRTTLPNGGYGVIADTSLAAAIVSGISALLLSQNPQLKLPELKKELQRITSLGAQDLQLQSSQSVDAIKAVDNFNNKGGQMTGRDRDVN